MSQKNESDGRFPSRCSECGTTFRIAPSMSMKLGMNSGHCTCPNPDCKTFLHVELLEGEASTEPWGKYMERTKGGVA